MKKIIFIIILIILSLTLHFQVNAQSDISKSLAKEDIIEAKITSVIEEHEIEVMGKKQWYQKLKLDVTKGKGIDRQIVVENGNFAVSNNQIYKTGDKVILVKTQNSEGKDVYYISDFIRRDALLKLFIIFTALTIIIARWRGLFSLLGMILSFAVIFYYILPSISSGSDPVVTAIIGSLAIIPATFFLSHGFNKKTIVAIAGTLIALIITGVLANIFVELASLTGFASEESGFLQVVKEGAFNIKGLLLAGIIIGVLGVLDDITISQSAIVFQLKNANKKLSFRQIFRQAMDVGRDHISSMVNTLVLVYTGASLPLLILFIDNPHPFSEIVNYEIIADEIVRTLVGSIGLILAVPITTLIASVVSRGSEYEI